jgi:hypothetical protein
VAVFAVAMAASAPAAAFDLGTCGPSNQGQVKSLAFYNGYGMLSRYYEFTCYGSQWEMTYYLDCNGQGECINLT